MSANAKRKNAVATIVVSIVLIVLLSAALVVGILFTGGIGWNGLIINFGFNSFAGGSDYSIEECALSADAIQSLDIAWAAGSVEIIAEVGRTEIEVSESGNNETHKLCWKQGGDTLYLRYTNQRGFLIFTRYPKKALTVRIPADMELSVIDLDVSATKSTLTGLNLRELDYDSASGGLTVIDSTIRDKCNIDSASGAAWFENVICGELDIDMASGGITFSGEVETINQDTASGAAEYRLYNCPRLIEIDSASGGVTIYLPADAGFDAKMDAASGKLNCGFPNAEVGKRSASRNGDRICKIDMDCASGNLSIQPNE